MAGSCTTSRSSRPRCKHGIDVVAIVFADGAYGNVRRMQKEDYGNRLIGVDLHNPNFPKMAESFGVAGVRTTTPDGLRRELGGGAEAARHDLDRGRGRRNARSVEASGPAAGARRPLGGPCSTRRNSRHCAPNMWAPKRPKWRRPISGRRCRWCLAADTGGRCRLPGSRPSWICPTGRRRPTCRILAGSTSRWSACRWISASPTGPAPGSDPARCATSSASAPTTTRLGVVPRAECKAADIGDVPMRSRFSLDSCIEDIEAFYRRIQSAGVRPLSVGGDHSITYPILKALGRATGRSASSISTRIATRWASSTAPSSTTAARSARRCSPACSTPSARSRSASAARPRSSGGSPTSPA